MQGASNQDDADSEDEYPGGCVNPFTEGLVVQQLLGRKRGMLPARLRKDLDDLSPEWVDESVASLEKVGVVITKRTRIHPTAAMQRLDDLNMICI